MTEEGDETVLHCYLWMPRDVLTNIWLASEETAILEKETGIPGPGSGTQDAGDEFAAHAADGHRVGVLRPKGIQSGTENRLHPIRHAAGGAVFHELFINMARNAQAALPASQGNLGFGQAVVIGAARELEAEPVSEFHTFAHVPGIVLAVIGFQRVEPGRFQAFQKSSSTC